mgnify:CR=1 FL=1
MIQLKNTKVKFVVKLLQYHLNAIIYRYNQKFSFKEYIVALEKDLTSVVLDSGLSGDREAVELLGKVREIIKRLREHLKMNALSLIDLNEAIDKSIRFTLFQYSKNKEDMTLRQMIDMLDEVKLQSRIVEDNNLLVTDRVKNLRVLENQLRDRIYGEL